MRGVPRGARSRAGTGWAGESGHGDHRGVEVSRRPRHELECVAELAVLRVVVRVEHVPRPFASALVGEFTQTVSMLGPCRSARAGPRCRLTAREVVGRRTRRSRRDGSRGLSSRAPRWAATAVRLLAEGGRVGSNSLAASSSTKPTTCPATGTGVNREKSAAAFCRSLSFTRLRLQSGGVSPARKGFTGSPMSSTSLEQREVIGHRVGPRAHALGRQHLGARREALAEVDVAILLLDDLVARRRHHLDDVLAGGSPGTSLPTPKPSGQWTRSVAAVEDAGPHLVPVLQPVEAVFWSIRER